MADSDGPPPDAKDPRYLAPLPVKPVAPAPRVNPPNINSAKEAPAASGPQGFGEFLEWMRTQMGGETAPTAPGQRGLIPKERKKFQKRDTDAKADVPTADVPVKEVLVPENDIASAPVQPARDIAAGTKDLPMAEARPAPTAEPVGVAALPAAAAEMAGPARLPVSSPEASPGRVRRERTPGKRNSWLGLAAQLGVLVLLAGSFILGRLSAPTLATPPPAAPAAPEIISADGKPTTNILSEANASLIDQAMAAEQADDFKKAGELLDKVKASGQHVVGLAFQQAILASFRGDDDNARSLLNSTLSANENVGDAYNLRATLSARSRRLKGNVLNEFATAAQVDPFDARIFFYWGEALRRVGKDQAALVRLQQAVDRLREPELEGLYRLKLRLAKIEAGREKDFADELAAQLALPNPEMDWLITAAAEEIHRSNFAAAAGFLDRAMQRGDAETFASRLRDFYLYQFQYEKDLARFYPKTRAGEKSPAPGGTPAPSPDELPAIGLDMPAMPPPASPGTAIPR